MVPDLRLRHRLLDLDVLLVPVPVHRGAGLAPEDVDRVPGGAQPVVRHAKFGVLEHLIDEKGNLAHGYLVFFRWQCKQYALARRPTAQPVRAPDMQSRQYKEDIWRTRRTSQSHASGRRASR